MNPVPYALPDSWLLLLGSNVEREFHMARATRLIEERYTVLARSRIYESPAVGDPEGPAFFNRAVMIRSSLGKAALRAELHALEADLGRVRTSHRNAPRVIDIDLLLAVDAAGAVLADPPPEQELRHHYAALPAAEIAGDLVLPGEGITLSASARALGPPPQGFTCTEPDPKYPTSTGCTEPDPGHPTSSAVAAPDQR